MFWLCQQSFCVISEPNFRSIELNINIDVKELAYYDQKSASWKVEKGNYIIYVGNGSRNISKEIEITII